jgi:predicted PurR-regulated permease PerM
MNKEKIEVWINNLLFCFFNRQCAVELINMGHSLYDNISKFVCAKMVDSLIIGILTYLGSKFIIDTPYPAIDGIIIGTTNIIPYFGGYIGGIPMVLLNILYNPYKGFLVLILIIFLQELDALVLGPRIMSEQLSINPLLIILSIIIGGGLFGTWGFFLATPVAALLKTSADSYIKYKLKNKV